MQGESSTAVNTGHIPTARMFDSKDLVSDDILSTFEYVVNLWICSIVSYVGIINNIIIIIVFAKMGYKETINISMTAIAIWDFVRCDCSALNRMYGVIELDAPALSKSWNNVTYIVFGIVYTMAGYTSSAMAAYVALERCLCVSMPFTVKYLLTRKIVVITNVVLSFVVFASYVVSYSIYDFIKVTNSVTNETSIAFIFNAISSRHYGIIVYLHTVNTVYPVLTFGVMCICTILITYHLKKASVFRAKIKTTEKADGSVRLSSRDRQVIKMLLVIILVYIVTFLPRIFRYIAKGIIPGFYAGTNLYWMVVYVMVLFEVINSSINIFIFYFMSSQFKSTFRQIFHMGRKTTT